MSYTRANPSQRYRELQLLYLHMHDQGESFLGIPAADFDGVVCTDVLEHCPEDDMAWIVGELFAYARRFVFANVACYPARKRLPNGENAHCAITPAEWWSDLFGAAAENRPELQWEVWVQWRQPDGSTSERRIGQP